VAKRKSSMGDGTWTTRHTRRSTGTVASPTEATYVEKCCRRSADALESAGQEAHDKKFYGEDKKFVYRG
jgi:hypothetical protein